jgi:hypothetical protein
MTKTAALSKSKQAARAVDEAIERAPKRGPIGTGEIDWKLAEQVLLQGDLGKLTNEEQTKYVLGLCKSLGLNPLTRPFQWIILDGKLTLYSNRNCTDQLRAIHNINIQPVSAGALAVGGVQYPDVYVVQVLGVLPNGRQDTGTGAVSIRGISGVELANAVMRAETKAKRRVTLSICGLSFLDESELDTVKFQMPEKTEEVRRVTPPPALQPAPYPPSYPDTFQAAVDKANMATVAVPGAPDPIMRAPGVVEYPKHPIEDSADKPGLTPPGFTPAPAPPIAATTPVQPVRGPLPPPARPSAPPVAMPSRPRR